MKVLSSEQPDGSVIVRMNGQLDLYNSMKTRDELLEIYDGGKDLVFDLCEVEYADSSGIGIIANLVAGAMRENRRLAFKGIKGQLRNILRLNRILKIMRIVPE